MSTSPWSALVSPARAARELTRRGHDVLVLEGRDRVGGRSTPVPSQASLSIWAALSSAHPGCRAGPGRRTRSPDRADLSPRRQPDPVAGRVRSYRGTIPKLSLPGLLDIARVRWQFERIARAVPLVEPWAARRAEELDSQSLGGWLRSVHAGASTRDLLAIMARVTWGCEPTTCRCCTRPGTCARRRIGRLLDVEGGAQQDRFAAGTQQIAEKSATELGERLVLDAAVSRIDQHSGGVTVSCEKGRAEAQFVIVAIPPATGSNRVRAPASGEYQQLPAHWPQGRLSKAYAAYPTPFWRANGLSGKHSPIRAGVHHFRRQPAPSGRASCWVRRCRSFDPLPADERRRQALAGFASLFGHAALSPIDYIDFRWAQSVSPRRPTAAVPPVVDRYGRGYAAGRAPPLADTETADEWTGFWTALCARAAGGRRGGRAAMN
ncbi:flavin containing amine oxidoreductase family protein [Mycobacterium xenopi 4042]|uniref:Flavin containing amine oxidoreductase family protein n=1 Tax=Mycobacterium xenopi 4042 TaxID=1299334 RepID=X7Z4A6_MYCXE|nr:flavin containing amine oxidoreductase family protein [Mycobacterium xenopi 4042]